jgi:hypothetical protein
MNMIQNTFAKAFLILTCLSSINTTFAASFDHDQKRSQKSRRVQKRDEWKNIGIASAAASVLGLLTRNGTVSTLGAAGALYSAYRYEEDRKSSRRQDRERARLYSQKYVRIDGRQYKRQTVKKHGKMYYQFVRA